MKFSKVIYFLIIGTILATIALLFAFDQQDTEDKKEVDRSKNNHENCPSLLHLVLHFNWQDLWATEGII